MHFAPKEILKIYFQELMRRKLLNQKEKKRKIKKGKKKKKIKKIMKIL